MGSLVRRGRLSTLSKSLGSRTHNPTLLLAVKPQSWTLRETRRISWRGLSSTTEVQPPADSLGATQFVPSVPESLRLGLQQLFDPNSLQQVARDHERFLDSYGAPGAVYGWKQALAYTGFKMLPAFGVVQRVLHEVGVRIPEFAPKSMLDFGAGPGTSLFCCADKWPSISEAVLIEPSRSMTEVCEKLLGEGLEVSVGRARSLPEYIGGVAREDFPKFDIVTASYTFGELPSDPARLVALSLLWEMVEDGGILVLVEGATPHGLDVIAQARTTLVEEKVEYGVVFGSDTAELPKEACNVQVIAPCTHALACPMAHKDYPAGRFRSGCHFVQRTQRLLTNPSGKGSGVGRSEQTEKFSYIVMRKRGPCSLEDDLGQVSRILRKPLLATRHVIMDVCGGSGKLERRTITKANSSGETYRRARKSTWGQLWHA